MSENSRECLSRAASLLRASKQAIAFTGAGISVESGIPPFRGQGGIWDRYDSSLLELSRFESEPALSWAAIKAIFYETAGPALPNAAHRILAEWETDGILDFLVTQNIDGLHEAAGSRRVAEYHGSLRGLTCRRCGARVRADAKALAGGLLDHLPPPCPTKGCAGLMKPDFVFFGETIPSAVHEAAFAAAERADLCLVVGSTGIVYPAALVPLTVKRNGGVVIEIDPGHTEFSDSVADVHISLGAVEGMTRLDALVRGRRGKA